MNSLHKNSGFTIEIDPVKLDTKLIKENGTHSTAVHYKVTKITPHWTSAVPKRYKRNTINGESSRGIKISLDFETEKKQIHLKFNKADYPPPFVNSVIKDFESKQHTTHTGDDDVIIQVFSRNVRNLGTRDHSQKTLLLKIFSTAEGGFRRFTSEGCKKYVWGAR